MMNYKILPLFTFVFLLSGLSGFGGTVVKNYKIKSAVPGYIFMLQIAILSKEADNLVAHCTLYIVNLLLAVFFYRFTVTLSIIDVMLIFNKCFACTALIFIRNTHGAVLYFSIEPFLTLSK